MSDVSPENLPAAVGTALGGVPKSLVPSTVKAIDRLIGGAIDIPAAWLAQKKAKIDAQTEAYKAVETAIAKAAASEAGTDPEIVGRAVEVLVRKSYREQRNREAVAKAAVEELGASKAPEAGIEEETPSPPPPDEEWLNIFEQYAERASTERMQRLWGRVLAGEIRRPGQFSMRTLRFLSEFSQEDARLFANLAQSTFGDCAPLELIKPPELRDIRPLAQLEACGLAQGLTGMGLQLSVNIDEDGYGTVREGNLGILIKATPNTKVPCTVAALTPLGLELLSLVERDKLAAARRVAFMFKSGGVQEIQIAVALGDKWHTLEVVWTKSDEATA